MGDTIIICDNVCLGTVLTSTSKKGLKFFQGWRFMTVESFWEVLLLDKGFHILKCLSLK